MAKVFRYIHFYRTLSCLLLFHIACTSTSLIAQPSDVYNAGVYTDFPFLPNIRPLDTAEINREIRRAAKLSATQTDSAFRLFQYTLVISSHMRYSDGIITSLKCISKIKVDQGYLEEAIFFYKKQIDYCIRHQGAAKYLASAYNNL